MKKNKYRWREMKDEKPELGEFIFIAEIKYWKGEPERYASRVQYIGKCEWRGVENSDLVVVREFSLFKREPITNVVLSSDYEWRKMCKLPGEK